MIHAVLRHFSETTASYTKLYTSSNRGDRAWNCGWKNAARKIDKVQCIEQSKGKV